MKTLIISIITLAAISIITPISAQNYQTDNPNPVQQRDTVKIDLFMPGAYLQEANSEDYYYNTYEITKLEWEVNQLASFYKGESIGNAGFSSDKYSNLTDAEKKKIIDKLNSFSVSWRYDFKSPDRDTKKSIELFAGDYFNRFIAPYISVEKEKPVDKEKLQNEIRRRLDQLFELKEVERLNRIDRLEKELTDLKTSSLSRDKNKPEIIEQRLKKLIGVPANLKW